MTFVPTLSIDVNVFPAALPIQFEAPVAVFVPSIKMRLIALSA